MSVLRALDKFRDDDRHHHHLRIGGPPPDPEHGQEHIRAQSNNLTNAAPSRGWTARLRSDQHPRDERPGPGPDQRIALVSPASFDYYAPELNTQIKLGGQYVAAALAGCRSLRSRRCR